MINFKPAGYTNTQLTNIISQLIDDISTGNNFTYQNSNPVDETLGGIHSSSDFFSTPKTLEEIISAMFYPTYYPTFTDPSSYLDMDLLTFLEEVGDTKNIIFTNYFDRGIINPAYGTSGLRSGPASSYHYTGTGLIPVVDSSSIKDSQTVNNYNIIEGIQNWTGYVSYDEGEQPKDSRGENYDVPFPAGSTSAFSVELEGVYPLYATTINITTYTKQHLFSMLSGNPTLSLSIEHLGDKQTFDIPNAWLSNRTLKGILTQDILHHWTYQGGDAASSLTYWDSSTTTHDIQGNTIDYTRYVYNGSDRLDTNIRLEF